MIDSKNVTQQGLVLVDAEENFSAPALSGDQLTQEYIERLHRAVYKLSGLPDSDELVHVIGHGDEKSNFDALKTLIMSLLDKLSELPKTQHLERVMEELSNRFHEIHYLVASKCF